MANETLPYSRANVISFPTQTRATFNPSDFYIQLDSFGSTYEAGCAITIVLPDLSLFYITVTIPNIPTTALTFPTYFPTRLWLAAPYLQGTNIHATDSANNSNPVDSDFTYPTGVGIVGVYIPTNGKTACDRVPCDGTWTIYFQSHTALPSFIMKIKCGPLYFEKNFSDLAGLGALNDYVTIWNAHTTPILVEPQSTQSVTSLPTGDTRHYTYPTPATPLFATLLPLLPAKQPARDPVSSAMAQEYAKVSDSGYYVEFSAYINLAAGSAIIFIAPNGDVISCIRDSAADATFSDQRFLLNGTFVPQRNPQYWRCESTITADTPIDGTWQIIVTGYYSAGYDDSNRSIPITINLGSYRRFTLKGQLTKPSYTYQIWNAHEGSYSEEADANATNVTDMATGPRQTNVSNVRFYDSYGLINNTANQEALTAMILASLAPLETPAAPDAPTVPSLPPATIVFDPNYTERTDAGPFSRGAG